MTYEQGNSNMRNRLTTLGESHHITSKPLEGCLPQEEVSKLIGEVVTESKGGNKDVVKKRRMKGWRK